MTSSFGEGTQGTEQAGAAVTLGGYSARGTFNHDSGFHDFFQSLQANDGIVPRLTTASFQILQIQHSSIILPFDAIT
jgi:hypothetical protein